MNLWKLSIQRPVFAWMLMTALVVFGAISFSHLGLSELPDIDYPVATISVTYEGAAPEVIESDLLDPIEDAVSSIEGVTSISSIARSGSAQTTIEFALDIDIDNAVREIETRIAQAQRLLPDDIDPPIVQKMNPEDRPILWFSLTSTTWSSADLMLFVRDRLKNQLTATPGVADILLGGYVEPNLRVWVSQERLNQEALSVNDVIQAIAKEHREQPAGRIETSEKEYGVRTLGEASTVADFKELSIQERSGRPNLAPLKLSKIARVEDGLDEIRRFSRFNQKPSVGLGIRKQRGVNAVAVARAVKTKVVQLSKSLPEGIEIGIAYDGTTFVEQAIDELLFTLVLSALLTAGVCWIFLGSWSITFNVVLAIPTSIVGTFIALHYCGYTLNTFTLLGLTLAIGIVVDDSIMVSENITRHAEQGESRRIAAYRGTDEISFAAIAATISVVAIFIPIFLIQGAVGRFFWQLGVTLSVAVLLSLLEALTLTPMRCSQMLTVHAHHREQRRLLERAIQDLASRYQRILPTMLRIRWLVITLFLLGFAASLVIATKLHREFVPSQDQSRLMVRAKTKEGSSLQFTNTQVRQVEAMLAKNENVLRFFVAIGGFSGGEVNSAMIFLTLKDPDQRPFKPGTTDRMTQQEVAAALRGDLHQLSTIQAFVQDLSQTGLSARRGFPIEFTVRGPDWETLTQTVQMLLGKLRQSTLVSDVDSNWNGNVDEIHVRPLRPAAEAHGVTVADIADTVRALVGGVVVGKFSRSGHRYDIRLQLDPTERRDITDLSALMVRNNRGELIPLSTVAKVVSESGPQTISRENRERSISIFANVADGVSQATAIAAVRQIATDVLPNEYHLVDSGNVKALQESSQGVWIAWIMGLVVAYMILASQFNSFVQPLSVLLALPLSVSGALIALAISHQTLNLYSMIGLLLLMGIAKKNSIILVDMINQRRREGMALEQAIINACPIRLRPIVMTSVATIAGAIPAALALGPGAEIRIPMAMTIIGGTALSTVTTLFIVPCFYRMVPGRVHGEATLS